MALSAAPRRAWPGWRHLPRDSRDTLFLLAVIGWTVLPHAAHLAPWCIALTALMLFWRAQLALSNAALPSRWAVVAVLAVAVALTLWTEQTLFGKQAGVTLLVVLMALKTLELRARRDAMVVFFLGFFLVLTNFLYSQSLLTAAAMLLSVWGLLTALVLAHMPVGKPSLRQAGALAARAAALGTPLMVALFLLFPRIGPLWGMPHDAAGTTGLSGSMRMGAMAFMVSRIMLYAIGYFGAMHYNVETDQIGQVNLSIHWKLMYGVSSASLIVPGLKVLRMLDMTPIRMG